MKARKIKRRGLPIYALYLGNEVVHLVVRFTSLETGTVVESKDDYYKIGHYSNKWIEHTDKIWKYLPDYKEKH